MGFNHRTPLELLEHLRTHGGDLNHLDVTGLIQELQKPWDQVNAPVILFARGDKIERQLVKAGQAENPTLRLAFALSTFEASGEFEPSIREWKAKPAANQTFTNFRIFMQKVFADRKKHDKTTTKAAGCGIANSATDEKLDKVDKALAIAEVAMVMKSNQEKQFKQMMELFKEEMKSNVPGGAPLQAPAPAPTQPKPRK
ncbi:hypothetical protein ACHAXN_000746, partial [Cyclotella atomus]